MNYYYLLVVCAVLYDIVLIRYDLQILQQNVYNENQRYLKWGLQHVKQWLSISLVVVSASQFFHLFVPNSFLCFFFLLYFLSFCYHLFRKKEQDKIPLHVTSRLKRMIVTLFLFHLLVGVICYFQCSIEVFFFVVSILCLSHFWIVYFVNLVHIPIEKIVFLYYKRKAIKKLSQYSSMKVIGITGSYGKTSSKNILNGILNESFHSFATPKNYNTQYGLMITINQYLDKFEDFFIAEMGAYKRGRIKLCCDLVHPSIGILTNIGTAHLESFGSQENIQKGKFELIESLPSDGLAVLNKDDSYQVNYPLQNTCKVVWISISDSAADYVASNIQMNQEGMTFDVFFRERNKTVSFSTKLLGIPNVYNILASLAVCDSLSMSFSSMQLGVKKIRSIPHRLELHNHGSYTIIDDAYNSNPVGAKMALDVLSLMDGKKVVVTPGMVELGSEQYRLNFSYGCQISEVADLVLLIGEKQTKPILDGLKSKHFDSSKIFVLQDVREVFSSLAKYKSEVEHTYFLLENDLPDIYNE